MEYALLISKISEQYNKKLPFVLFSMPEENDISAFLQKNDQLLSIENFTNNGFVFAPFDFKGTALFISESNSEIYHSIPIKNETSLFSTAITEREEDKKKYLKLTEKAVDTIKNSKAAKIVISREKTIALKEFTIEKLTAALFGAYPSAFTYIWFHPKSGLWCGATPETLLQVEGNSFKTMALAGTQTFSTEKRVFWGKKEIDEQQLVTDAITNSLQRVTSVLKVSNPYTYRAGALLHLRTDISGVLKKGRTTLTKIASVLHPTPAVCGSPQQFAKKFILENEDYDRTFYTGFLGPISENGDTATLLVNLRCMKIEKKIASVFVGGGITIDSQPLEEWNETQNKLQTMLQVLRPML